MNLEAKLKFEQNQLLEDLFAYQKALKALATAFDKFVDSKGLTEIDDQVVGDDHKKIDKLEASKKRVAWKQIGIDDTFNL